MTSRIIFFTWLLIITAQSIEGQNTFNSRYHFDTPAAYLTSIIATDSCYYATGIYADTFPWLQVGSIFAKFNLDGTPVFTKKLIHPQKSYDTRLNTLTNLDDGTFVVTAYSFDPGMKGMLIKYDEYGDTLWTKEYLNPFYPTQDYIVPIAMAQMDDGGFAMSCWIQKNAGNVDIYLIKTDSLGDIQWESIYNNPLWDRPYSILLTPAGKMIVGAARSNIGLVAENYIYQNHIFQVNTTGTIEWTYLSPTSLGLRYGAADMVLLEDGSLVVASGVGHEQERTSVNTIYFDKHIFKLNPMQEIEWEITFAETALTGTSFLTNLISLSDNSGFVAAGTHGEEFDSQNAFSLRGWIGKVSPDGDSLWTRQYIGLDQLNNRHTIYDLKETPDGGFLLCGESRNPLPVPGEIAQQAWLLKLDQHGCLVPGCHLNTTATEPEQEAFQLAIYPNPATDYLNFFLHAPDRTSALSFRILDAAGRVVQEIGALASGATYILPVSDWPRGAYVLQGLEAGKVLCAEKFIKQ